MPLKARKTVYRGIEMRSRLEAHWARYFDLAGTQWEYEPECFADETGQYLPDFRITVERPGTARPGRTGRTRSHVTYVDTKGVVGDPEPFLKKMAIIWSTDPTATLVMIEGHGERSWMGFVQDDGSAYWAEHDDQMSLFQGPEAA